MSRFPRYLHLQLELELEFEDAAKGGAIVRQLEAVPEKMEVLPYARGGDWRRMRGLPIVGCGVPGASPGTDPARAVLEMEPRRRRLEASRCAGKTGTWPLRGAEGGSP